MDNKNSGITSIIGAIPYRMALAGGWIDQPFISKLNPSPPGSMVVVNIEPEFRFMDRAGICSSTRLIALKLWNLFRLILVKSVLHVKFSRFSVELILLC